MNSILFDFVNEDYFWFGLDTLKYPNFRVKTDILMLTLQNH